MEATSSHLPLNTHLHSLNAPPCVFHSLSCYSDCLQGIFLLHLHFADLTLCSVALGSSCHAGQPHNCLKKTQKREGRGYRIPRHHFTFWWFLTMMAAEVVLPAVRPCNESQPGTDPAEGEKKRYIFQPNGLSYCVLGQGKL